MSSIEKCSNNQLSAYGNIFTNPEAKVTPSFLYGEINPIDSYNQSIFNVINELKSRKGRYFFEEDAWEILDLLAKVRCNPLVGTPGFPTLQEIWELNQKFCDFFPEWDREWFEPTVIPTRQLNDYIDLLLKLIR